jgi:hypothetical protein
MKFSQISQLAISSSFALYQGIASAMPDSVRHQRPL